MDDAMDLDFIDTNVKIYRPIDIDNNPLREFSAKVEYSADEGPKSIGSVRGWIGWNVADEDVHDAADAISVDAETLGATAVEIMDDHPDAFVDTVVLIDRMHLDPIWRGKLLSGVIIDNLLSLLRLDRESTAVVLQPEPQKPEGGPLANGPERDAAMAQLGSVVWWRPF